MFSLYPVASKVSMRTMYLLKSKVGKDKEYQESYKGRLIEVEDLKARYLRFYSKGNTADDFNHYVEVEVYGK